MPMIQRLQGRSHRDPDFIEMRTALRVLIKEIDRLSEMKTVEASLLNSLRVSIEHLEEVIEEYEAAEEAEASGKELEVAETKGTGWVEYMFPKPGQTDPSQKWTYVKKVTVDGVPGLVASGFYPE